MKIDNDICKLQSFSKLEVNWDSYGANPPTDKAIDLAIDIVKNCNIFGINFDRIAPSVVGGIGLTIRSKKKKLYIEIYNNNRIFYMVSRGSGNPIIQEIKNITEIPNLIKNLLRIRNQ